MGQPRHPKSTPLVSGKLGRQAQKSFLSRLVNWAKSDDVSGKCIPPTPPSFSSQCVCVVESRDRVQPDEVALGLGSDDGV